MSTDELPADVREAVRYLAENARLSGYFKWNEEAKLKADMMNVRRRWGRHRVSPDALKRECEAAGLDSEAVTRFSICSPRLRTVVS
ncbi:hypothetical protein [Nocardia cerradoensis]|uniref:Uncharacterized protein n=1 Tax=Nocardia cerradoensis TaxID=85688 RepID=A0A231GSY8_9NOCA|nr:hypothetical protein [Nocardia cerradoensis]NKY43556.1 hypothetical protein [Nocardia cerradoensis]OXR39736.1 hypothetical protein B7C42_08197 [Nocardia cerradoensis]